MICLLLCLQRAGSRIDMVVSRPGGISSQDFYPSSLLNELPTEPFQLLRPALVPRPRMEKTISIRKVKPLSCYNLTFYSVNACLFLCFCFFIFVSFSFGGQGGTDCNFGFCKGSLGWKIQWMCENVVFTLKD